VCIRRLLAVPQEDLVLAVQEVAAVRAEEVLCHDKENRKKFKKKKRKGNSKKPRKKKKREDLRQRRVSIERLFGLVFVAFPVDPSENLSKISADPIRT
jgi:hypothetical protein